MSPSWRISDGRVIPLDQPRIMGILNVTPDSFSDGGRFRSIDEAVDAALRMHAEGARIVDVGGESTRPGAAAVPVKEQVARTRPVIEAIRRKIGPDALAISIDTTRAEVAIAALDAGADIVNDVSAGRDDAPMLEIAASRGCGVILMHRLASPRNDSYSDRHATEPDYGGDVVGFVRRFLLDRAAAAIAAGVQHEAIAIDPGLGFGKSVAQNFELIRRTAELADAGFPVLSAASRKSFIGKAMNEADPARRDSGSVAASLAQYASGARLFRVHDVALHAAALRVAAAIGAEDAMIGAPPG